MTLEERVARLEARLGDREWAVAVDNKVFLLTAVLAGTGAYTAFRGVGQPNHPYQVVLGVLTVALAYHRRWLPTPKQPYQWALAPINAALLSMIFKLVIGGGIRQPMYWLKYPSVTAARPDGKWVPEWSLLWLPTAISNWQLDFTVIQTFLLIVTLIGALFDLDLFVSLTAFLLILISIPIFATFEWSWVFPALLLAGISFYLQSQVGARHPKA